MKYLLRNRKRVFLVVVILVLTVIAFYFIYNNSVNHDALMIKEKYERINDTVVEGMDGKKYQSVYIKSNAPIKNVTVKEAVEFIKEDKGILFIGYSECPWCRNALPVLLSASLEEKKEVMYLDAKEVRDEFEVVDGKLKKTKKASKYYYELLELLDDYLDEYKVYDEEKKEYDTKEKRIYVPFVVFVNNKEIVGTHTGTVDLKENQSVFDKLDEKQKEELKKIYLSYLDKMDADMCTNTGC